MEDLCTQFQTIIYFFAFGVACFIFGRLSSEKAMLVEIIGNIPTKEDIFSRNDYGVFMKDLEYEEERTLIINEIKRDFTSQIKHHLIGEAVREFRYKKTQKGSK